MRARNQNSENNSSNSKEKSEDSDYANTPDDEETLSFPTTTLHVALDDAVNNFDPADPIYKILCNCGVVPSFVAILCVQFFISLAASVFSLYQIVALENADNFHDHNHEKSLSPQHANSTTTATPPSGGAFNWSRGLEITFFLCQHWYPLIYIRFIILLLVIFSIGVAVYGVHAADVRFVKIYITFIFVYILFLLTYIALLSWHAITYNDYFSFCFFGLILFTILLLNVAALHTALVLCKFIRHTLKFWNYALERNWIDNWFYANSRRRVGNNRLKHYIFGKYDIPTELLLKLRQERKIRQMDNDRYRLGEIEEADDENDAD